MIAEDAALSLRTALVVYGTETGTAQDLAFEAGRLLERYHFNVDVDELDSITPSSLARYALTVFVLSTTGQGDFPSNARQFWKSLLRKKLTSDYLSEVTYTVVGIGDSSYPKFNWAARKLEKRIVQLGAVSVLQSCEADEQGEDSTDGAFLAWSQLFASTLQDRFPLPSDLQPIPPTEALPSKWTLAPYDQTNGSELSAAQPQSNKSPRRDLTCAVIVNQNTRLTPPQHWQDVRFIQLKTQTRIDYYPGDAIAIRPMNLPGDVQQLLTLMSWEHVADLPICLQTQRRATRQQAPITISSGQAAFTLRQLLTEELDISAIPRRSFFATIARYTDDDMHKERLLEFADPQYLDEYYDYATRPRRSILEVLQEFDSLRVPWQETINVFPVMRARQFSIASGGMQKADGSNIDLLVAIVKYRTVIKRIREGVCSKYLVQLPVGAAINVTLKTEGRFHSPAATGAINHILIGAGTGIAPLRSLVNEKRASRDTDASAMLIFGCRNADADYFFRSEWEELARDDRNGSGRTLDLVTAFSRDQKQKIYVQDKIKEHGATIRGLLTRSNATIIVCGSSGAMPKAVRQALVDALSESSDVETDDTFSVEKAQEYLARLEKEGRYKQETW